MGCLTAVDHISYEGLYARREQGNWRATEIAFSVDREQWQNEFSAFERHAALWNYAMFFHCEDTVTDALSPYIDAAPHEDRKSSSPPRVDEAARQPHQPVPKAPQEHRVLASTHRYSVRR